MKDAPVAPGIDALVKQRAALLAIGLVITSNPVMAPDLLIAEARTKRDAAKPLAAKQRNAERALQRAKNAEARAVEQQVAVHVYVHVYV